MRDQSAHLVEEIITNNKETSQSDEKESGGDSNVSLLESQANPSGQVFTNVDGMAGEAPSEHVIFEGQAAEKILEVCPSKNPDIPKLPSVQKYEIAELLKIGLSVVGQDANIQQILETESQDKQFVDLKVPQVFVGAHVPLPPKPVSYANAFPLLLPESREGTQDQSWQAAVEMPAHFVDEAVKETGRVVKLDMSMIMDKPEPRKKTKEHRVLYRSWTMTGWNNDAEFSNHEEGQQLRCDVPHPSGIPAAPPQMNFSGFRPNGIIIPRPPPVPYPVTSDVQMDHFDNHHRRVKSAYDGVKRYRGTRAGVRVANRRRSESGRWSERDPQKQSVVTGGNGAMVDFVGPDHGKSTTNGRARQIARIKTDGMYMQFLRLRTKLGVECQSSIDTPRWQERKSASEFNMDIAIWKNKIRDFLDVNRSNSRGGSHCSDCETGITDDALSCVEDVCHTSFAH